MTGPEVTAAVRRATAVMFPRGTQNSLILADVRNGLAAALDIEEIARVLFDLDNPDLGDEWRDMAWADMGGSERSEERVYYELHATCLRAALIGEGS